MRENASPCRNASLAEAMSGRHTTWNDDRLCNACRKVEIDAALAEWAAALADVRAEQMAACDEIRARLGLSARSPQLTA